MLSLAQAMESRGASGAPLPAVFKALAERQAFIRRSQVTLLVGPASAGKSLLAFNLLVRMGVPALAALIDSDSLEASSRFAAVVTGEPVWEVEQRIEDYKNVLLDQLGHIRVTFSTPEFADIKMQMAAYEQRYGDAPAALLVDNLGNMTSGYDNEWAILKALTLDLTALAGEEQCAVIACAHTTDLDNCEPAQRSKILGKISQYPRLILSVGYNPANGAYKIAVVKNRSGKTDLNATRPITLYADPSRMLLTETPPHPQTVLANRDQRPNYIEMFNDPDLTQQAPKSFGGWRG